jgi:hypothetical protein
MAAVEPAPLPSAIGSMAPVTIVVDRPTGVGSSPRNGGSARGDSKYSSAAASSSAAGVPGFAKSSMAAAAAASSGTAPLSNLLSSTGSFLAPNVGGGGGGGGSTLRVLPGSARLFETPSAPTPQASAPKPMWLTVHIRDLDDCKMHVGFGTQKGTRMRMTVALRTADEATLIG